MTTYASLIVVAEPDEFDHKERNFFSSIATQTCPPHAFELIKVDDHEGLSRAPEFIAFRQQHPALAVTLLQSSSAARAVRNNQAAAHASGDLLIFLADDFDPSPDLVAAHMAYHALNPDVDAVGIGAGLFTDAIREDRFARWLEDSGTIFGIPMRRAMAVWPSHYFYAGNASIKKVKFNTLGGFDERFAFDAWDDYEFGLRWAASGGYSALVAAATATHRHAVSFEERCATMERAGASALTLERLHPELPHEWRALLERSRNEPRAPATSDTPAHARIAHYGEQLDAAFRRGYLLAAA